MPRFARCKRIFIVAGLLALASAASAGEPSVTGQTGLVSMPDARFAPEGSWRTGLSFLRPYQAIWSSVSVFPWLEPSFRYTRIYRVPGFASGSYGDFKDKGFDLKLRAFPETESFPSVAVGIQDMQGAAVFRAYYAAASKRFGELDLTLGYGAKRIDGLFGGARWSPHEAPKWSFVAEYDAYDYKRDPGAQLSGAAAYRKEPALGVEYRQDWWGVKAFAAHGELGFNVYVNAPLEKKEFIPKIHEPAPYTRINPRPTEAQWRAHSAHRTRLAKALAAQEFRELRLGYENGRLEALLTNTRISSMPRAVGRAARTLLSFAPLEVREIRITYLQGTLPLATYSFIHVPLLQRYFNGMASREQLAPYVAIEYARPAGVSADKDRAEMLAAFDEPLPEGTVIGRDGADAVVLHGENVLGGRLRVRPGLATYFNDPSGAFKYEISALASYTRPLGAQTFLQAEAKLALIENVSDVTQASNSTLPHVRSDVAEYNRAGRFRLTQLLVNRFYHPSERVYARASAGIYEEMYSGIGGQALYLPATGRWAIDFAADWVRQREFKGGFGHRDYSALTAIASLNYRLAKGVTATLRGGRFLARDEGVRAEVKRRFASGFEVGAWYTATNGKDITNPGSPANPYHDKGIFMAMPLDALLTDDTQAVAGISLSPWTRDVGQMVASPGDLYRLLDRPVLQMHSRDGLERFGDREDDYSLPSLGTGRDRIWPDFLAEDYFSARRSAGKVSWLETAALGAALTLGSSAFDQSALRFADRHSSGLKESVKFGNRLPLVALGLSGLFAFDDSRAPLSDAGVAALAAGGVALLASAGLKYAVGRARPTAGLGKGEFDPGNSQDRFQSFPSRHTAVMWAALTPYAREFGMPWLYGVAALTNVARTGSREHWFSDTVAGSLLGYALGHLAWDARRESRLGKPSLAIGPGMLALAWELP